MTKRIRKGASSAVPISDILPRTQLLWRAMPERIRELLCDRTRKAASDIAKILERSMDSLHGDKIVAAYLVSVFMTRLATISAESKVSSGKAFGSGPMRLHSLGFWFDHLKVPEEACWLAMTVPRRVWAQIVADPVKRQKFFKVIAELFPDDPFREVTENGTENRSV